MESGYNAETIAITNVVFQLFMAHFVTNLLVDTLAAVKLNRSIRKYVNTMII